MKKVLLVLMALVVIGIAGEMFLVEVSREEEVRCPLLEQQILEVTFTLDKTAFLMISQSLHYTYTDGLPDMSEGWFSINEEKLLFSVSSFGSTYMMPMDSGQVTVQSWVKGSLIPGWVHKVKNPILQVMVFYPLDDSLPPVDSGGFVSSLSVLSSGPFVHVEGCNGVYDVAGNKVDCEINNGDVYLNRLSVGTYFATGSEGRTTKIVKLK